MLIKKTAIAVTMIFGFSTTLSAQTGPVDKPETAQNKTAKFSVAETDIGTLLDNPATKAILVKHLPDFISNPQVEMARPMTLKQIQSFAADMLTDEVLAKIDAELATVA
jgi:hypothetical protein